MAMAKHRRLICTKCGKEKSLSWFYSSRKGPKLCMAIVAYMEKCCNG